MNDIRAFLKFAARRINLNLFIGRLHIVATAVAAIALALMISDRVTATNFVPWIWIGPGLAVVAISVALAWWSRRRPSESHVAVVVDEKLDLREKLSTALNVAERDDPFAQAAVEDAVVASRDGRVRERLHRSFPVEAPRGWWLSPLVLVAVMMVWLLNPMDLFRKDIKADANLQNAKLDAQKSIEAIVKTIEEKPELAKALGDMGELSKQGTDPNAIRKPEDAMRDALKKVTDLNKKIEEITNGEKGKTNEAVEKALNQLKTPEEGPAKNLAEALAKGDFAQAQAALKDLMDKAQNGQMNDEDKKKAAEQLKNIADQLEKLAQQQQQMQNALKQAGMDPKLAGNPQAMQQAIQNNQNLNQQQKQQLQQMAQAQQAAAQMCQGLGGACQKMAAGMQQGQGQMGQGAQQMAQQLGQMEQMQQLLQEAQAAAGACKGQCQGLGQNLALSQEKKPGNGMGKNWGFGNGGKAEYSPTPTGTKAEKANVNTVEGDVIAKMLFDGQQVRGDSKAKIIKVVEAAKKGFDEGQTEDQVHVKYRDAQKHYFGELDKLTKGTPAASPAAKSGEAPASAAPQASPPSASAQPAAEKPVSESK